MFTRDDVLKLSDIESVRSMSDMDFEYFCKYLLDESGYGKSFVTKKGPKGGDRGIDLKIYDISNHLYAEAQCKKWSKNFKNSLMKEIRELGGCLKRDGISKGVFIITIRASSGEKREAQQLGINLIDADGILTLLKAYKLSSHRIKQSIVEKVSTHASTALSRESPHEPPSFFYGNLTVLATCVAGLLLAALILIFWSIIVKILAVTAFLCIAAVVGEHSLKHSRHSSKRYRSFRRGMWGM